VTLAAFLNYLAAVKNLHKWAFKLMPAMTAIFFQANFHASSSLPLFVSAHW
jgi:hypothetical protein